MAEKNKTLDTSQCIHCGKCRMHCTFLEKYKLDLSNTEELRKLAYHCFLCGKCTQVCPKGIDGREIILRLRQESTERNQDTVPEKGYDMLLAEKKEYLFRNYRHATGKRVLFPGCNFPSFYPETLKRLSKLLAEEAGIGMALDCCGKPVAELGLKKEEQRIVKDIQRRLDEHGVEEVIMLCPNCYYYLKPLLRQKVSSIYEVLSELGIGQSLDEEIPLYLPCPDREKKEWAGFLGPYLTQGYHIIEDIQCCGLGGCAGAKEPELAKSQGEQLRQAGYAEVYTYCASCCGQFTRAGVQAVHLLPAILGTGECADVSRSLLNRAKWKFK